MGKRSLIYGVGVNDADYPVHIIEKIGGRQKNLWRCPFYRTWVDMMRRCYSAKELARCPTYAGCSVTHEWLTFSAFREWMSNRDWEGKQLDKDILFPGNKVYGPTACVFVSGSLNKFLNDHGSSRGQWPLGVCWDKQRDMFLAQCSNPLTGINEKLGHFRCPEAAHESWRTRKHEIACSYADKQTDLRVAEALRARYINIIG